MNKIFLLIAIVLSVNLSADAQNVWTYSANGHVEVFQNGEWKLFEAYQILSPTDSIRFAEGSSITILDRRNEKLFAVQMRGSHSVQSIIIDSRSKSNYHSKDFISFLWNSLRNGNNPDKYRKPASVVYRDDDINSAIAAVVSNMSTNLPVEFELLDGETGCLICDTATFGGSAVVKVKNHSASDLFVNIIDVDADGNMSACIPVNSVQQMTQLLIPAQSQVVLESFPIVFGEPRGEDELILVACPYWFDIDSVILGIQSGRYTTKHMSVGVFKQRLIVK